MTKLHAIAATGITSIVFAATAVSPAFAWHPQGDINKSVVNVTQNGKWSDADTEATAVTAKPGDILTYEIKVSDIANAADHNYNDMYHVQMTDTLPAGLELVSNPSQRTITENVDYIQAQDAKKFQYQVKVTSNKDGDVITNKACYTAQSGNNDTQLNGCDTAVVKVNVPAAPVTPTPQPTPAAPVKQAPATLPNTGASDLIAPAAIIMAVASYAAYVLRLKRVNA